MKKTLILLLLIALLALTYLFVNKQSSDNTSITIEDRNFVVENPDDIQIITIKSKAYPLMHLNRENNYWVLNQKYKADPIVIKNMLAVLTKMRIKYIPPRAQNEMIFESVARLGIEIKTYNKEGKILSDFIMATNTNDESGTYILKRGAQQAYVMSMPIVEGGLRNYFNQTQVDLRDKTIFSFDAKNIKSVSVNYLKDRKNSFSLETDNSNYKITAIGQADKKSKEANSNLAYAYFQNFNKLMAEHINQANPELYHLEGLLPFAEIIITTSNNKSIQLDLYPELDIFDKTVNTRSVDDLAQIESYFVKTSDGQDYLVQHRLLSKCLKTLAYFESSL